MQQPPTGGRSQLLQVVRAWRRVKMLLWISMWAVFCLTLIKLSIPNEISGVGEISIRGDSSTGGVLWLNLMVTEEKNE